MDVPACQVLLRDPLPPHGCLQPPKGEYKRETNSSMNSSLYVKQFQEVGAGHQGSIGS